MRPKPLLRGAIKARWMISEAERKMGTVERQGLLRPLIATSISSGFWLTNDEVARRITPPLGRPSVASPPHLSEPPSRTWFVSSSGKRTLISHEG